MQIQEKTGLQFLCRSRSSRQTSSVLVHIGDSHSGPDSHKPVDVREQVFTRLRKKKQKNKNV